MRRAFFSLCLLAAAVCLCGARPGASLAAPRPWPAPDVVDRIVARIEGDVILLSEVRELASYQQLVDGRAQPEDDLIRALIEQWVVRNEAEQSQYPAPPAADVDAEVNRIQGGFANPQAYRDKLTAAGLTQEALRRIVERQLYLERYLDYKFRPAVQIDDAAMAKYYQEEFAPALRARGQTAPPLDDVSDQIREVLIQRGINERADTWFEETKSRLQIEIAPSAGEAKS